jgi:membrane-associated phospholipid phosphatase
LINNPNLSSWRIAQIRSLQFLLLATSTVIITGLVHTGIISSADNNIEKFIRSLKLSDLELYVIIIFASLGEIIYLIFASIILTLIRRTRKAGMIVMITVILIALIVTYLKPIIGHEKPSGSVLLTFLPKGYNLERDSMLPSARNFSFPSNHTAVITAFSYIVGFSLLRRYAFSKYLFWLLPLAVAVSQVLLYESYISDVIGGFLLGFTLSILMSNIMHLDIPFSRNRFNT